MSLLKLRDASGCYRLPMHSVYVPELGSHILDSEEYAAWCKDISDQQPLTEVLLFIKNRIALMNNAMQDDTYIDVHNLCTFRFRNEKDFLVFNLKGFRI